MNFIIQISSMYYYKNHLTEYHWVTGNLSNWLLFIYIDVLSVLRDIIVNYKYESLFFDSLECMSKQSISRRYYHLIK